MIADCGKYSRYTNPAEALWLHKTTKDFYETKGKRELRKMTHDEIRDQLRLAIGTSDFLMEGGLRVVGFVLWNCRVGPGLMLRFPTEVTERYHRHEPERAEPLMASKRAHGEGRGRLSEYKFV